MPLAPSPIPAGPPPVSGAATAPRVELRRSAGTNGGPPAPGSLRIKERRSWKTWQLVAVALVGLLVGMAINAKTPTTAGSSARTYTPPPPAGSTASSTPASSAPAGSTATTAAAASGSSPTTAASSSGAIQVLVPRTQSQGDWTSPTFTIASSTWYVGWAYQCTPVPASGPAFQIFIVPSGGQAQGSAAVTSGGATGDAVSPETTPGSQQIIVHAPSGCVWVVKVSGVGGA